MSMIDQLFAAEWISNWWWLWKLIGQFCLGECNDCKLVWKLNKQRNYDEQDRVIGCENVYGWQAKSIDFRLRRSAKFSVMAPLVTTFKLEDHEKKIALYLAVLDHIGLLWFLFSSYLFFVAAAINSPSGIGLVHICRHRGITFAAEYRGVKCSESKNCLPWSKPSIVFQKSPKVKRCRIRWTMATLTVKEITFSLILEKSLLWTCC